MRRIPPFALGVLLCCGVACSSSDSHVGSDSSALSTGSTTIPSTGQSFEIAITSPIDGATVPLGTVNVTGNVTIGGIAGAPVNIISIVDLSGSTGGSGGRDCNGDGANNAADDYNGDGTAGDILDCEISGVIALNTSLFGAVDIEVGITGFGDAAAAADMQPGAGDQPFTSPAEADLNHNTIADHEEVARSLDQGSIQAFTAKGVGSYTNFDAVLTSINASFGSQPPGEKNIAFFMSDGNPCFAGGCSPGTWPYSGLAGPLGAAKAAGTVINTFAVGTSVLGCSPGNPLYEIAAETNGKCTEVTDPTALSSTLPGQTPSGIDRVEVNGVVVPVDAAGNFSASLECTAGEVLDIEAIGYADDPDNTTVVANITVQCCDDDDGDGICNGDDTCPNDPNNDIDGDGVCGGDDNCPDVPNTDQSDMDGDGAGDVCDPCPRDPDNDIDGDGVCGDVDNCPADANTDQADGDGDGAGDVCDSCPNDPDNDIDGDGVCGDVDNCPADGNADQADADGDGVGDVCDSCPNDADNDSDGDGVCGDVDQCAGTQIPESVPTVSLGVNRWALVDGDGVFDTTSPSGNGPGLSYTIEDTAGCSCEQIIEALDKGKGHVKFGCSISTMDEWIAGL